MDKNKAIEDVEFIKKIISDSRKTVIDNGMGYIVWGIVIFIGLILTYFTVLHQPYHFIWNWVVVIGFGWIYSIIEVLKGKKTRRKGTATGRILGSVWFAVGIGMTILGFVVPLSGAMPGYHLPALLSIPLGIAFFISGVIYDFWWVVAIAVGWWIGGIIMFFYPGIYVILLMAGEMLFFQVLPGIIIYRKFKKEELMNNA